MIFPHNDTVANKHKLIALMVNIIRLYIEWRIYGRKSKEIETKRVRSLYLISFQFVLHLRQPKLVINDLIDNQPDRKSREIFERVSHKIFIYFWQMNFFWTADREMRKSKKNRHNVMWMWNKRDGVGENR